MFSHWTLAQTPGAWWPKLNTPPKHTYAPLSWQRLIPQRQKWQPFPAPRGLPAPPAAAPNPEDAISETAESQVFTLREKLAIVSQSSCGDRATLYLYPPLPWPGRPPELPSACRCPLQRGRPAASSVPAEPKLRPRTPSHSLTGLTHKKGQEGCTCYKSTNTHTLSVWATRFILCELWDVTQAAEAGVLIKPISPQACQPLQTKTLTGGSQNITLQHLTARWFALNCKQAPQAMYGSTHTESKLSAPHWSLASAACGFDPVFRFCFCFFLLLQ